MPKIVLISIWSKFFNCKTIQLICIFTQIKLKTNKSTCRSKRSLFCESAYLVIITIQSINANINQHPNTCFSPLFSMLWFLILFFYPCAAPSKITLQFSYDTIFYNTSPNTVVAVIPLLSHRIYIHHKQCTNLMFCPFIHYSSWHSMSL